MKTHSLRAVGILWLTISTAVVAAQTAPLSPPTNETPAQHDARMAWWREARFGLLIHWGLYAVPAGTWHEEPVPGLGDWIMQRAKIPVQDYAALAGQFQPAKFNADAWVALAKGAGVKYLVVAAKPHDGFAMFRSKASPFNIHDATPFKRARSFACASGFQTTTLRLPRLRLSPFT